jgi:PAS domain S-box-containing protein
MADDFGTEDDRTDLRVLSRDGLEAAVRERTAELQNVMDTMADLLIKLDADGRIEMTNRAVETVLGYDSLAGKRLDYLLASPEKNEALAEMMTHGEIVELLFSKGAVTDLEVLFERADGQTIPMNLSASVMEDDGSVSGIVCVAKDISEIKRREREAKLLNDVLGRILRHNMRNKLTAVQLEAELLPVTDRETQTAIRTSILEYIKELTRTGEKARTIADVIYEFDDTVELDVVTAVRAVVETAREQFDGAVIETDYRVERAAVVGHQGFEQAVSNLVENAIEHNDDDPHVEVTVDRDGETVVVTVVDDGPGIPESEIAVLRHREETALEHGSGAGLWLVDWIVEKSGGQLSFDRTDGRTIATIRLPGEDAN